MLFNSGEVIKSVAEIPENCIVIKCGAETGLTIGHVFSTAVTKTFDRPDIHQSCTHYGQIEIRSLTDHPFSAIGDSGSLVFAVCKNDTGSGCKLKGLGLLIGSAQNIASTFITPIWAVLSMLKFQ